MVLRQGRIPRLTEGAISWGSTGATTLDFFLLREDGKVPYDLGAAFLVLIAGQKPYQSAHCVG